jgi:hypothetical protein
MKAHSTISWRSEITRRTLKAQSWLAAASKRSTRRGMRSSALQPWSLRAATASQFSSHSGATRLSSNWRASLSTPAALIPNW